MKTTFIRLDAGVALEPFPDFPETEISSGARDNRGHLWVSNETEGLEVGVWESEPNLGRWMHWPVHEFMVIVEGEVVMIEEDRETVIGPGESFFIPKGRRCVWNQSSYAKKLFMIFDDKSGVADGESAIFKIDPSQVGERFDDPTDRLRVGVREMTGRRDAESWSSHELIRVLDGELEITDDAGGSQVFAAGRAFFVPFGAVISWKAEGTVRVVYCTLAAAPI